MTKKTPLEPLGNRVLVMRLESEKTVKGGILLPESAKKKTRNCYRYCSW